MKTKDDVGVEFVNAVVGRGTYNGVVNLSFSTFNFTPDDKGNVELDPVISVRLRMDRACAAQLRDVLNDLFASIEKMEIAEHETSSKTIMSAGSENLN
jgi:hypothetical protein